MESSMLHFRADAPSMDKIQQKYPPVTTESGVALIVVAVIMPIIATVWTVLRIWTRRIRGLSPFLTEDVLCYLGLISFWGLAINYICMVALGGAGYHIIHLREPHIVKLSQTIFAAQVLYALTLGFTKMSITWMMKRIFFEQSYAVVAYAIMAFCFAWMVQTVLTGVLICQPVNMNWDPALREVGHCGNQMVAFAAVSIVDIITDILILVLPIKLLWDLQMKQSYKIALGIVFGAGFATIAFTIVRLYFVFAIDFNDISYSSTKVSIIGTIQPGVAIIVASAALMRPVFDRTVNFWLGASMGSRFSGSGKMSSGKQKGSSAGKMSTRSGLPSSAKRSRASTTGLGFHQISESEENLRWELDVMHADKGKTLTEVSNDPTASFGQTQESLPIGQIKVTQSTHVSRQ